jgi:hypothetical protein
MGRACAPPFSGLGHGPAARTQRHCPPGAAHSLLKRRRPRPSPPERARQGQKSPVDTSAGSEQYRDMLGETQNQFSLTRPALSTCGHAKNQIPISYQSIEDHCLGTTEHDVRRIVTRTSLLYRAIYMTPSHTTHIAFGPEMSPGGHNMLPLVESCK